MKIIAPALIFMFALLNSAGAQDKNSPMQRAHAHNDYKHRRPLEEALELGYTSIEIDIFSYGDELKVAHIGFRLKKRNTIEELYIEPLLDQISKNGGRVFPGNDQVLTLLIDLKADKDILIDKLTGIFQPIADYISSGRQDEAEGGVIRVILTGGPPRGRITGKNDGIFAIDGGMGDFNSDIPVELMPLLSSSYKSYFKWNGKGKMPEDQLSTLRRLVADAHQHGRKVRFWASPQKEDLWQTFLDEGVDYINVDKLYKFRRFYDNYMEVNHHNEQTAVSAEETE